MAACSFKVTFPPADRALAPKGIRVLIPSHHHSELPYIHAIKLTTSGKLISLPAPLRFSARNLFRPVRPTTDPIARTFYYLFDQVNEGTYLGCDGDPRVAALLENLRLISCSRSLEALSALARDYLHGDTLLPCTPAMGALLLHRVVNARDPETNFQNARAFWSPAHESPLQSNLEALFSAVEAAKSGHEQAVALLCTKFEQEYHLQPPPHFVTAYYGNVLSSNRQQALLTLTQWLIQPDERGDVLKKKGLDLLIILCKEEFPAAQSHLKQLIAKEIDIPLDALTPEASLHFACTSIHLGLPKALYDLGIELLRDASSPLKQHEGFSILHKLNTEESQETLRKFSISYLKKLGTPLIPLSLDELATVLQKLALEGKGNAEHFIGTTLFERVESPIELKQRGLKLLIHLAKKGHEPSIVYLTTLLRRRTGATATPEYCQKYFHILLKKGKIVAKFFLATNSLTSPPGIDYNFSRGMRLLKELSESNYTPAQFYLANLLCDEKPRGYLQRATTLLRAASDLGHKDANLKLAHLLETQDDPAIVTLYERAAAAGVKEAANWITYRKRARTLRMQFR